MDVQTHTLKSGEAETIEKLRAANKTLQRTVDDLQNEVKALGKLKDGGVLPTDNEPFFILVARDPIAPIMVEAWGYLRQGKMSEAASTFQALLQPTLLMEPQAPNDPQIRTAFSIARQMKDWFKTQMLEGV